MILTVCVPLTAGRHGVPEVTKRPDLTGGTPLPEPVRVGDPRPPAGISPASMNKEGV